MDDLRFLDPEAHNNREAFNERFGMLNQLMFGLGNQYLWEKNKLTYALKYGEAKSFSIVYTASDESQDKYNWQDGTYWKTATPIANGVELGGQFTPNQQPADNDTAKNYYRSLMPFYFKFSDSIFYVTGVSSGGSSSVGILVDSKKDVTSEVLEVTFDGYVNSPDPSAYPPAEPDGYTYTALGQLGSKVRIETGSYTGTGTYGSSSPNSLTFGFSPDLVIILDAQSYSVTVTMVKPSKVASKSSARGSGEVLSVTWEEKTVKWYETSASDSEAARVQLNYSGTTYYYIAIG